MINIFREKVLDKRAEKLLFFFLVLFNASILFHTKYVPTLDGGSHLYNAHIIQDLWLHGSNSVYHDYFRLNSEVLPNWFCYLLFMLLKSLVSFNTAEKIILACFLFLTPYCFRALVRSFQNSNLILSYLIFPFTQFSLLYLGFYNFSFGLVLFLVTAKIYVDHSRHLRIKGMLILFVCFVLLYFTHLFAFLASLIFMFVYSFTYFIVNFKEVKAAGYLKWIFQRAVYVLLPAGTYLFFTFLYYKNRPTTLPGFYLGTSHLLGNITNAEPLRVVGGDDKIIHARYFIFYAFC